VHWLQRLNRRGRLAFEDVFRTPTLIRPHTAQTRAELLHVIHGAFPDDASSIAFEYSGSLQRRRLGLAFGNRLVGQSFVAPSMGFNALFCALSGARGPVFRSLMRFGFV
jgi:hypothetical protein